MSLIQAGLGVQSGLQGVSRPDGGQPPGAPRTGRLDEVLGDGPDDSEAEQPAMALVLPRPAVTR